LCAASRGAPTWRRSKCQLEAHGRRARFPPERPTPRAALPPQLKYQHLAAGNVSTVRTGLGDTLPSAGRWMWQSWPMLELDLPSTEPLPRSASPPSPTTGSTSGEHRRAVVGLARRRYTHCCQPRRYPRYRHSRTCNPIHSLASPDQIC